VSDQTSHFADIFAEDDALGLLAQKPAAPKRSSGDEIAIGQFESISTFVDEYGVLPGSAENGRIPNLEEYTLEGYLDAFRGSEHYRTLLANYDRHGLFGRTAAAGAVPTDISEILDSDDPLLSGPADGIFKIEHLSEAARNKANAPDEVAQRRPCAEFERFAPIFSELKEDLKSGRRYAKRFTTAESIVPGAAFILNGIISYVATVDERKRQGKDYNGRIRVVFDNGTEAYYLWRSFARAFYEDENGRQIVESAPSVCGPLFAGEGHLSGPLFTGEPNAAEFGEVKGTVYIVESLAEDPQIVALRGRLCKIGFTTQDPHKRLADAEKDPTFLCAPVHLRATYETNFSPRKLEQLLHQFFAHANLQVEVVLGKRVVPKEWFVVPLDLVEEAVERILDRSIVNYRYDSVSRKILLR
jgi:hypothetical protein